MFADLDTNVLRTRKPTIFVSILPEK